MAGEKTSLKSPRAAPWAEEAHLPKTLRVLLLITLTHPMGLQG